MSLEESTAAVNERMIQISSWIDENDEAARLQGSALAGVLLGAWLSAGAIQLGYSPLAIVSIMTIGTIAALAIRMSH
jgi:hypothetical protein